MATFTRQIVKRLDPFNASSESWWSQIILIFMIGYASLIIRDAAVLNKKKNTKVIELG